LPAVRRQPLDTLRPLVEVADFHVCRHHTRPLRARAQKPAASSDRPRSVERVPGDQQLHALSIGQVRAHNHLLRAAVGVQEEHFERIAEIIVVELVIADSVQPYRRAGRDHKVERGTQRSPLRERCRQPTRCNRPFAYERYPHEATGGVRFEFQQAANLVGSQISRHRVGFTPP
jgi:hypothetical protein